MTIAAASCASAVSTIVFQTGPVALIAIGFGVESGLRREADAFLRNAARVLGPRAVELDEVDHARGFASPGEAAEGSGCLPHRQHQCISGHEQAARSLDGLLSIRGSVEANE